MPCLNEVLSKCALKPWNNWFTEADASAPWEWHGLHQMTLQRIPKPSSDSWMILIGSVENAVSSRILTAQRIPYREHSY